MIESTRWGIALISFLGALLLGQLAGRLIRASLARKDRPAELRELAAPVGLVVLWSSCAVGMLIAVAALNRDAFERIPDRAVGLVPDVLIAAIIVICGYAISIAATASLARTAARTAGLRHRALERAVRLAIATVTAVLALSQLGVDSAILAIALGLFAGAPLLAAASLTALGGRDVARGLAAGRAVRAHVRTGHRLRFGDIDGIVTAVHQLSVEVETDDGRVVHIPTHLLLEQPYSVNPTRSRAGS